MSRLRLAHISDTHFGTEVDAVVDALRAVLAELAPDVILLCGDVTQRARPAEFAAARRFMESLPARTARLSIPGNHDLPLMNLWARFRAPYAGYEEALGPREGLWAGEGIALVLLDATHPLRHKDGALDAGHLARRLDAGRAACGGDGVLLVAAHQPLWTAWGDDKGQTLRGRHAAARQLADARADVVFSGHVHVPLLATSAVSDPHLAWRFVLSGAGTAVSHRVRPGAPNSFNLLELDDRRLRLVRYDCNGNGFAPVRTARFRRDAASGWSEAGV